MRSSRPQERNTAWMILSGTAALAAIGPAVGQRSAVRLRSLRSNGHRFTSMAERSPSESKLNEIEVMKIIAPGNAATQGCV